MNYEKRKAKLLVLKSALELGTKVNEHLLKMYNDPTEQTLIVPTRESWFNDGHSKVELLDTVRGEDVYILTDIGNHSITYEMHGSTNRTSPNDLESQLKDAIGACKCHTGNLSIVIPLLYAARQHRRNNREPLSCARFLHELDMDPNVKRIVTFDAHDVSVQQALFHTEFDNFFATNVILEQFINNTPIEQQKDILFIAPDSGAMGRMNFYLNAFNNENIKKDAGFFYKRRDYNKIVDGKNPIIEHSYSGSSDIKGKTAIVVDDMIASGGSVFDVVEELKKRGVEHIYVIATFSLLTKGIDKFKEYYEQGKLDGIYTTNLSYIAEKYRNEKWLHICDCSEYLAQIIYHLNQEKSISELLRDKSYPAKVLTRRFNQTK